MRSCYQSWLMMLAACLVAGWLGCKPSVTADDPEHSGGKRVTGGAEPAAPKDRPTPNNGATTHAAQPEEPPPTISPFPPPTIPPVELGDTLGATCLVKVGHAMPDAQLQNLNGTTHALHELYGKKLTVVFFWSGQSSSALQELADLGMDVAEPYAQQGVKVVAVNVRDTENDVRQSVDSAEATIPVLLDPAGSFFSKVATEKVPRTYLLQTVADAEGNPQGKILWFDVEYSRSTRRDLKQAIQVALGEI